MPNPDVPINPIALTVMAVNRLGPAMLRAVSYGTEVLVTAPNLATCEIFRAALRETQKRRTTDRLIRIQIAEPA
jgi:hypothetical protein